MRRALELAWRGVGKTSPNPAVGAVLVRNGRLIGEGWHRSAGSAHAEVAAIQHAQINRQKLAGSSLYVTLEPCCTHGRTPPCTEAILRAGIRRVVVAATDPNPRHRGRGLRLLRRAGLRVETGLLAEEAEALNPAFNQWITTRRPFVIAKAALSLDGQMATQSGDSRWITSETARRTARRLRAGVDAVMVGVNTVIRDDPQLTLRLDARGGSASARQPWRVVLDSRGRCPLRSKLVSDRFRHRTMLITTNRSSARWRRSLALRGITVLVVPAREGRVDLAAALRALGEMEVTSVLIEGGPTLLRAAFDAGVVNRVALFFAPKVIAGAATMRDVTRVRGLWQPLGRGECLFEGDIQ